eukprot:367863-Pleurochrysis_carterae.AAC.1
MGLYVTFADDVNSANQPGLRYERVDTECRRSKSRARGALLWRVPASVTLNLRWRCALEWPLT